MSNNKNKVNMVVLSFLVVMTLGLTLHSAYGQSMGNATQSTGGNASQDIGTAEELSQSLGNNTEIMANKTPIGNPNASMAEKGAMESNVTGNQSMQTGNQAGNETGNQTGNQSGNQTNPISGLIEGIGKLLGNATGK
jgi:hypothetical protein